MWILDDKESRDKNDRLVWIVVLEESFKNTLDGQKEEQMNT